MNPPQEKCSKCGASLAGGVCRQCLLLAGIEPTSLPVGATAQESLIGSLFPELADIRPIGRGGMGVVYRARQRDVDRDIALKLLPLEMTDAPDAEERFEVEARAAARLDHPHIITLYEFGERGGSLFLKMKLVENGRSLAHALKERSPWPAKDAVALLAKLASAVHHAHQHGIIHRDIKPGNVLLDPRGEPMLSDFGLARIVEENTSLTHSLMVLGTASYMAPEQADGKRSELTTAADVYSLGAVLYEMLSGRLPFDGASTAEILRHVIEDDPAPPCVVNEGVDRDLSTICLKCLEKNPARRYGSAEALAEDLALWQQGRPISARPISTAGRISKWARRRPAIALLASALAASVLIGSTLAIWQAVRATRAERIAKEEAANAFRAEKNARHQAANALHAEKSAQDEAAKALRAKASARDEAAISKAVNDFINNDLFPAASPYREPDRDLKVRTVLDRAAARIGNRFQDEPLVEAAIRLTLAETYQSLGEYEKAREHAEQSVKLRGAVLGLEHPDTLISRMNLANTLSAEKILPEAEGALRAVLWTQERVLGPEHPDTLISRMNLANALHTERKFSEAEKELRAVLEIQERVLGPEQPDTLRTGMNLANTLNSQTNTAEAETELRGVLQIQERVLGPDHPDTLSSRMNLASTLNAEGKMTEAEKELRAVVQIRERVLGPEHPDTLRSRMNLAKTLDAESKVAEGEAELWAVFQIQERVLGPKHHDTISSKASLVDTLKRGRDFAVTLCARNKFAEAEAELRAGLQIQEGILGPEHPDTLWSLNSLAVSLQKQDKLDEARNFALRAMEGWRRVLGAMHPNTAHSEKLYQELTRPKVTLPATQGASASLDVTPALGDALEWSRFRGPNGSGVAEASHLPATFDASNTVWRIDIGRGMSSPVGWKGRLFLTVEAAPDKRAILCLDRRDGKELWRFESAYAGPKVSGPAHSFASSTPFVDDERVYVMDSVEALALDHDGKLLWRNVPYSAYVPVRPGGHASAIVSDGVLAARSEFGSDLQWPTVRPAAIPGQPVGESCFVGLDAATGAQKWALEQSNKPNLESTPIVHETAGKHEFILTDSAGVLMGIDAASGTKNWQHHAGNNRNTVSSGILQGDFFLFCDVWNHGTLLKLGGAEPQDMPARIIGGLPYVATPLLVGDRLYLLGNGGKLTCVKFPSCEEFYSEQLSADDVPGIKYFAGAKYLSSPVAADGKIYCCSQSGDVVVVKLGDKFEMIAINRLDGPITATPAIAWNHLFVRTDKSLYCFGEKDGTGFTELKK